ncbi:Importin subunit beta-1, partial [Cucurbita argyrosperma subsp. argyrosperma]
PLRPSIFFSLLSSFCPFPSSRVPPTAVFSLLHTLFFFLPIPSIFPIQVLLNAQSIDANVRKQAEDSLRQFQEQNLPSFLLSLSGELGNEEKPVDSRKLARCTEV